MVVAPVSIHCFLPFLSDPTTIYRISMTNFWWEHPHLWKIPEGLRYVLPIGFCYYELLFTILWTILMNLFKDSSIWHLKYIFGTNSFTSLQRDGILLRFSYGTLFPMSHKIKNLTCTCRWYQPNPLRKFFEDLLSPPGNPTQSTCVIGQKKNH